MKNKQLKIGGLLSYLSISINLICGLIYTPWMVNQIGKGDYGLYTLANSLISIFLIDFGLGSAVSRYVSKYRAENRQDKIDNFLGAVYKLYLLIDAVIFIALIVAFIFIDLIYTRLSPEELVKFKVVYSIAAAFSVINFPFITFNGILSSYEKFIQLKLADVIYRILLVSITVFALVLGQGVYALVSIHAVVGLIIVAYKYVIIKKCLPIKVAWKYKEKSLYKDIFSFSVWITVATLAQRLIFNITPSILGMVVNSSAIAVFGIITTIEGYTYTITTAINGMFIPKISRIYNEENSEEKIMPLMIGVGRFQFAINGLILAGFVSVGKEFINLWMDPSFIEAYYGIVLVLIPGLFYNSLEIANNVMIVRKKVKTQAIIAIIMGVINIVLSFICSYYWGVIGACISIFVAYTFRIIASIIVYQKQLKMNMFNFFKNCYVRMGIPVIICIGLGFVLNIIMPFNGWKYLLVKAFVITVDYCIAIIAIGIEKQERKNLLKIFKKV